MPDPKKKISKPIKVEGNPARYNELLIDTSDTRLMNQLSDKFKKIHSNSNSSCTAGSLNCLTDFVQPVLGSPSVRSMTQQNNNKYKIASKERLAMGNSYVPNNSIDAWEIHNQLSGEGLGKNLINPKSKLTYKKNNKGEIIHQIPNELDYKNLPIGTILGQGDSAGVYTDPKEGTKSRHAMTIIGYDKKDGEPLVYDYGKIRRLSDNKGVDGSMPINNVTIPKGYEKYNKNYIDSQYNNYSNTLGYGKDLPIDYGSEKEYIKSIQKGVNSVKNQIGRDYGLSQEVINNLSYKLPGIANQESGINNNERLTKSKLIDNTLGNYLIKPGVKAIENAYTFVTNLGKDDGEKKKLYQIELDAYKKFPNDPKKRLTYQYYLKNKNDQLKDNNYQELSPSVGPFSVKNVPEYSKTKLGLDKGDMYGIKYSNSEELENGSKVALNILAENYKRLQKDYPNLNEKELSDLTVTSYNNASKQKDKEYVDYYIKNHKLKDDYVEKVNSFQTKENKKAIAQLPNQTQSNNSFADGGQINNNLNTKYNDYLNNNMKRYAEGGALNQFNVGGSHEQNPNGGIPQGPNATVEQGETSTKTPTGKYIYSDRLYINEDLVKQFNLPNSIKGKTFADASKVIDKPFKDKNSNPDKMTHKEHLDRLKQAQETLKAEEAQKEQAIMQNAQQSPGFENQQIPEGMEEFAAQQEMPQEGMEQMIQQPGMSAYGGFIKRYDKGGMVDFLDENQGMFGTVDGIGKQLQSNRVAQPGDKGADTAKNMTTTALNAFMPGAGTAAGAADSLITGIAGDSKVGKGIASMVSPLGTIKGIGSALETGNISDMPMVGMFTGNSTFEKQKVQQARSNATSANNAFSDKFAEGGYMNYFDKGGDTGEASDNWFERNGGKMLKYAPIAMNAFQLSQLKKPSGVVLDRLSNRYKPMYMDENRIQNQVSNEMNNSVAGLTNATAGSESALRANLVGTTAGRIKGMSDAYAKMNEYNAGQNLAGQQFNLGVDQANIGQSNNQLEINDRNQANYRNQRSKLLGSIGTDLGSVGKEEVNKNSLAEALGYTWDGKFYVHNKTGAKKTAEQVAEETTQHAYGGYLRMNKIGRR